MHKKLTITVDEAVYEGLIRIIGRRKISQFLEELAKPYVLNRTLEDEYKAMALDKEREQEAHEWCEAFIGDVLDEAR